MRSRARACFSLVSDMCCLDLQPLFSICLVVCCCLFASVCQLFVYWLGFVFCASCVLCCVCMFVCMFVSCLSIGWALCFCVLWLLVGCCVFCALCVHASAWCVCVFDESVCMMCLCAWCVRAFDVAVCLMCSCVCCIYATDVSTCLMCLCAWRIYVPGTFVYVLRVCMITMYLGWPKHLSQTPPFANTANHSRTRNGRKSITNIANRSRSIHGHQERFTNRSPTGLTSFQTPFRSLRSFAMF